MPRPKSVHVAWVNLTNGGLSGGSRKYLSQIVPRMVEDARVTRLDMLSPDRIESFPDLQGLSSHWRWDPREHWIGFPSVRRELRRLDPDVVYVPTARWVEPSGAGSVIMVRNMEPLVAADSGNPGPVRWVNYARRRAAKLAARRADRVIAVSDFVVDHLATEWSIPADKISRIYHGADSGGARQPSLAPAVMAAQTTAPFLFVAGSVRPMRGIEDAVRALARITPSHRDLLLLVAGAPEGKVAGWLRELRGVIDSLGITDRVKWAGKLSNAEMAWCFEHCRCFLMTSRVEACPNAALEAMSHGAVIVSTRNRPMPEFFGRAAVYYSAGDHAELAARITEVLSSPGSENLRRRAQSQETAAQFTWDACADQTIRELERGAASRTSSSTLSRGAG